MLRSPASSARPDGVLPPPGLTRRALLASSTAGLVLLAAGCTSSGRHADPVSDRQAEAMAAQARVQAALVAAYRAAGQADPQLAAATATMAEQAGQQLSRLRAATPSARSSASSSAPGTGTAAPSPAPPAGQDPKAWLAAQVHATADSHAGACVGQVGARAALLGSIAAGLRGQAGQLT